MIAEYSECRDPAPRKMRQHSVHLIEIRLLPRDEVACKNDDVRRECTRSLERVDQIVFIHVIADVKVADLGKRYTGKLSWKIRNAERATNELEPVRLDLCRISGESSAGEQSCARPDEGATIQILALLRLARIIGPTTNGMCPMS